MFVKTDGIVLRETEYKDNDKLLTVLTRELGNITVKALGVKSARSRNKAACQIFAYSEFTLLEYQGRYSVKEAEPKEIFPELRSDLELLSLASYFLQVTQTIAQENDPFPELLSLLLNSLYALSKLSMPQKQVKAVFELRTACISGFQPDLHGCTSCGVLQPEYFNISQGVLQCTACAAKTGEGIRMPLSPAVLEAMRYIIKTSTKRLLSFRLSEASLDELCHITESYLTLRLERGFPALDFYKSLFL